MNLAHQFNPDLYINHREELHQIINARGYKIGVEIGVEVGGYTEYLLKNTDAFIYGVDCWQHIDGYIDVANIPDDQHQKNMRTAFERLAPFINQGRCQLIKGFSVEFAKEFKNGSVDFVYIDANHSFPEATKDIFTWDPKVKEGGMISGHDYLEGFYLVGNELSEFGVISAVNEYLKDKQYRLYTTYNELFPSWYIIKE